MTEDRILIKNIHADILVGINPEEREIHQPVIVNVSVLAFEDPHSVWRAVRRWLGREADIVMGSIAIGLLLRLPATT